MDNPPLSEYLSRPVLIKSYTWTEGLPFNENFEPWFEYFNNAYIKKKLDNFYLLRCNLHLKFVINASPFYYSAIMVSYRPLASIATGTDFNPAPVFSGLGVGALTIMGRSQRPKIFLYPQNSQGGEMKLPFFWPKDWLNANSADDFSNMGTINMDSTLVSLLNANSVSGGAVDIQVYAWSEDLELGAPTYNISLQSSPQKDEYSHAGTLSKPASAVASLMNKLSILPVIGPFATASSMIASGISDLASLFGYTNVPVIDDVHAFKGQPFPHMSTTEIGVPCEKLTLDAKNELSIDPRINGIDVGDELMIKDIATREFFFETLNWASSQVTDDIICCSRVYPGMFRSATAASITHFQGSPAWMIQEMFQYWRGDVIYRFKFICTKYHRGRVRITWDPNFAIGSVNDTTTTNYNKIVDITEETDVEFCVPYTQPTTYLPNVTSRTTNFISTGSVSTSNSTNGVLTLRVLNSQTSPQLSADIKVLVFVRAGENFRVAGPKPLNSDMTPYTIQSEGLSYDEPNKYFMGKGPSKASDNIDLIYMGENIVSLRQLMRRQNFIGTTYLARPTANRTYVNKITQPRMPLYYGYDGNGIHIANDLIGVSASSFNYVNNSVINWINQCYVAHKGSVIWNINNGNQNATPSYSITASRDNTPLSLLGYNYSDATITGNNFSPYSAIVNKKNGFGGLSLTNQYTQSGLNVLVPMYSRFKFLPNDPNTRTLGATEYDGQLDSWTTTISTLNPEILPTTASATVDMYCSIGTDFSSIFFLNVPTLQILSTIPSAAL